MSAPLRVAGWGTLGDGAAITWTIAEGRRGRRWREVVARDAGVGHSLLLETDADRRFSHLELARADGLWTFHPEPDGTLHGNHVDAAGREIRHVVGMPFGPDDLLVIEGSALGAAAVAWRLSTTLAAGSGVDAAAVVLGRPGTIEARRWVRVDRLSTALWCIAGERPFEIDNDGAPLLVGGETRPLEID